MHTRNDCKLQIDNIDFEAIASILLIILIVFLTFNLIIEITTKHYSIQLLHYTDITKSI